MIPQYEPLITDSMKQAVNEYMDSGGWLMEFKKTRELEKMIAKYTKSRYCIMTSSGTSALFLSAVALSQLYNKPVYQNYMACPDYTHIASANAGFLAGYMPVLFDVEPKTHCFHLNENWKKFFKSCQLAMMVSINGRYPSCLEEFIDTCKDSNIPIIEDAAQSLGSFHKKKHVGTYGDVGCFSFSMPKIITMGNGGCVVTNNRDIYDRIKLLKDFGREKGGGDDYKSIGYNFKFTDLQAVMGIVQMKELKDRVKKKKQIYKWYKDHLQGIEGIHLVEKKRDTTPWFIDVTATDSKYLEDILSDNGIGSRKFYPPVHLSPPYNRMVKLKDFKRYTSKYISRDGLWLPSSLTLEEEDVIKVCNCIRENYQ